MFDKENSGEISIKHVYEMLNDFDKREKMENWNPDEAKEEEVKEPPPKKGTSKDAKGAQTSKIPGQIPGYMQPKSPGKRGSWNKCWEEKPEAVKSP